MWYSATKIGIADIDLEHGNIDTMLSMILSGKVDQHLVVKLIDVLINHFQNEEEIIRKMGRTFPEVHHAEHEKLTEALISKKQEWLAGEVVDLELAQELKLILQSHVAEFDALLNTGAV